ncbi:GreA/GreB family elongation factor [Pseudomonas sichuanensis]|uniref:GreA/GreB family elongation factor n=1 Tax=Pseudomonas sichuanensis TaxID=2213015 RepID=UPI00244BC18F|nr:GreA/GreB family elongation factor [Pseudomonas sichuanensis]MDH0732257.1 GreA/GreB family elongation factor [Pseudomonas sichuanensis]MDH1584384.1 GreA/GreB family elongation factor [Pseudomonas sichuanensis]MDH1592340.1 GreA/GreB family elongation factor [Pseudomonas sichuanensis]MDH1599559.1 GreA/GreB family elongation factor [Pseudomonas sichuanensis]
MSRAFVNEDQAAAQADQPVERRVSDQPNYVTATGLALLQQRVAALNARRAELQAQGERADKQQLADTERDLRYFTARVQSAQVVPAARSCEKVQIGSQVRFVDEDGQEHRVQLVGEDQADATQGLINWGSPLGRALLGAGPGDEVLWRRPAGDQVIEVLEIGGAPCGSGLAPR